MPVNCGVVENYMKYVRILEAGFGDRMPLNSGEVLLLALECPSPMEDYPVQPVPRLRDVSARDPAV